jgi:hypothetical protein
MDRLMILARLNPARRADAERLLRQGPPFDPAELGFQRHSVYLTPSEVVFLFEAPEVEWIVESIVDDPVLSSALAPWGALTDGPPRIAHEHYFWAREPASGAELAH